MPKVTADMINAFFDQYEQQMMANMDQTMAASQPRQSGTMDKVLGIGGALTAGIGALTGSKAAYGIGNAAMGVPMGRDDAYANQQAAKLQGLGMQRKGITDQFNMGMKMNSMRPKPEKPEKPPTMKEMREQQLHDRKMLAYENLSQVEKNYADFKIPLPKDEGAGTAAVPGISAPMKNQFGLIENEFDRASGGEKNRLIGLGNTMSLREDSKPLATIGGGGKGAEARGLEVRASTGVNPWASPGTQNDYQSILDQYNYTGGPEHRSAFMNSPDSMYAHNPMLAETLGMQRSQGLTPEEEAVGRQRWPDWDQATPEEKRMALNKLQGIQ